MLLHSVLLVLASAARFSLGAEGDSDVHDRVREYEPSYIVLLSADRGAFVGRGICMCVDKACFFVAN